MCCVSMPRLIVCPRALVVVFPSGLPGLSQTHHSFFTSSGLETFQFGVRARGIRVMAPSFPTFQTLRGAKSRSAHQTFSGSGISLFVAHFVQLLTTSDPDWTASPALHSGSLVSRIGCPSCPASDRKSTRLNSSHPSISYAVFCLKKKTTPL